MHVNTIPVPAVMSPTSEGPAQPTLYPVPARIPATSASSGYSMWNLPFLGLGTVLPQHFLQRVMTPDGPVLPQRTPSSKGSKGPTFSLPAKCEPSKLCTAGP
jgi:hypothetical protein